MKYAIAHAVKGVTFVAQLGNDGKPVVARLADDPVAPPEAGASKKRAKLNFLSQLMPGDQVVMELGGAADRLALAAVAHGAEVYRYQSFLLGKERTRDVVTLVGWPIDDERPRGKETGEELTVRKMRALALLRLSEVGLGMFMKAEDQDISLLRLGLEFRAFRRSQKAAHRAYQGLLSAYRDQAFLDLAFARQQRAKVTEEEIYSAVLERLAEDILGGGVSDTERADFFAAIGKEFEGGMIPMRATEDDIEKIVNAMLESDRFHATVFDRLKSQKKRIELLLKGGKVKVLGTKEKRIIPANFIWENVFAPIPGVGPLIGARIIAAIGDIRRFKTLPSLKAYAGYHLFEDGSRACRIKGRTSNWDQDLKQGVYLFCVQTLKIKDSPWRAKLDQRRGYELYKILRSKQVEADGAGLTYEILPDAFKTRVVGNTYDVTVADLAALLTHVDVLRKQAGVSSGVVDEGDEESATIKDPALAKLVRGVKQQALDKALRWLGQQFLKHVFKSWRQAVGLSELPVRTPKISATIEPKTPIVPPFSAEEFALEQSAVVE